MSNDLLAGSALHTRHPPWSSSRRARRTIGLCRRSDWADARASAARRVGAGDAHLFPRRWSTAAGSSMKSTQPFASTRPRCDVRPVQIASPSRMCNAHFRRRGLTARGSKARDPAAGVRCRRANVPAAERCARASRGAPPAPSRRREVRSGVDAATRRPRRPSAVRLPVGRPPRGRQRRDASSRARASDVSRRREPVSLAARMLHVASRRRCRPAACRASRSHRSWCRCRRASARRRGASP